MAGTFRPLAVAVILSIAALPAQAWTAETRVAMADEAVRLMPASLARALDSHRRQLVRGMLMPLTQDGPDRRAPWADGRLDLALEEATLALEQSLSQPTAFAEVAERFGRLAHYALEAGYPPGVSREDAGNRYAHFAAFCESRRSRFPLVFYGHSDPTLDSGDYRGFALRVMRRASEDDRDLARIYLAAGDPPDPAAFDDRSVPFAVASLAYSHSINDVVRLWLNVWNRAGGDVERTPYGEPPKPDTDAGRGR